MQIQIKRRGGLAGITLSADLDTSDLESDKAARAEQAVGRLLDSSPAAAPAHPDGFEYELTVPGRGDSVSVPEHELPSALEPLVAQLPKVGKVERPSGR